MSQHTQAERLSRFSGALDILRGGLPEMPTSWALVLLRIAERPGCTIAWLTRQVGLSASVVSRIVLELGPANHGGARGAELLGSVDDPINTKRKVYMLSAKGKARIEDALSTAFGSEVTYDGVTLEEFRAALAVIVGPPRVRTDHFTVQQMTRIKAAAARRFSDFVGANAVAFPLEPARALIDAPQDATCNQEASLARWVREHQGRWYEMDTIYPADGGVGLADFDDANEAFHFVLRWRGAHTGRDH